MNKIKINEDIIYSDKIKNEITIVHISDIHFSIKSSYDKLISLLRSIKEQMPNYVCITGDILDSPTIINNKKKINELVDFIKGLGSFTKVFIALGNHDTLGHSDFKFFNSLNELENVYLLNNSSYTDESIFIGGITLPNMYYYGNNGEESVPILTESIKKFNVSNKTDKSKFNLLLVHSPIKLTTKPVAELLSDYQLVLAGHTHGGMVPGFIGNVYHGNRGLIGPNKKFFPKIARGRISNDKFDIIINSGITKLSQKSGKILSNLNFLYDMDINNIIIKRKEDINNE